MPSRSSADRADAILNPTIDESFAPQTLIAVVPIRKDHMLADLGSGPGWLSIPLAKYVYEGKMYAVDSEQEMLDIIRSQAERAHLNNVETFLSKDNTAPLEDESVDGVVLSDVLNKSAKPQNLVKEANRLLRKGGWLAIVEWVPTDGKPEIGPAANKRIQPTDAMKWAEETGLHRVSNRDLTPTRYVLVFHK